MIHKRSHFLNFTLAAMKWFGLAALLGCSNVVKQGNATSGPFEIAWEVTESRSGAWFNLGGNPNSKQYTSWFSVRYKGKKVEVPAYDIYKDTPMEGTKPEKPVDYFWQALFLEGTPRPAVLVGVHSMHLITEENGQVRVIPIHEQDGDFATYQWLDSEGGQPGPLNTVYLGDDSGSSRFLSGGRYLLVNSKVILDVRTLETFPCAANSYEVLQQVDGYNAGQSAVLLVSPHGTQVVRVGDRDNPADRMLYQYALVCMDFRKNTAYTVPFDRTDTRFFSVWDADPKWLDTYFEWTTDAGGEDRLALRKFDRLPYWQGRWTFETGTEKATEYQLMPVDTAMLPVFLNFIRKEIKVSDEKREETPSYDALSADGKPLYSLVNVELQTEKGSLYVYLHPLDQTIRFSSDNSDLILQIGRHFDQALAKGLYQQFFGKFE